MTVGTAPSPPRTPPTEGTLPLGVWLVAAIIVLTLLSVSGRYGFHGDEFYFVVTGRHLQAAAPDNPMLVPYLAAGWYALVGWSPLGLPDPARRWPSARTWWSPP